MRLSARLSTLVSIVVLLLFSVNISPAKASSSTLSEYQYQAAKKESARIQTIMLGFTGTLMCQLSGIDIFNPGYNCLGQKMAYDKNAPHSEVHPQPLGALGFVLNGIDNLYQRPLTTAQSINYFANNFGIVKNVYAEDSLTGFQSLTFLLPMFLQFRNLAFILIVIVFVLIGMGIMLRFKIDPRTAMSIQNQLPKVIIGIILITFSYSIAGFLVDGMWFMTYFGVNVIGGVAQPECKKDTSGKTIAGGVTQSLLNNPIALTTDALGDANGCFGTFDGITGLSFDVGKSLGPKITDVILEAIGFDAYNTIECGFRHPFGCVQKGISYLISGILSGLAAIIALIAILVALVRLWLTLLKAYIYVILDVITAPFQILFGILPGGRMGFSKWLKHLVAHLLVFPAAAIMIVLAAAFALIPEMSGANSTSPFYPPLLGVPSTSGKLGVLIAFGIIMITPELMQLLKDAFGVKSNSALSGAVVGGFMRGAGPSKALGGFAVKPFGKDKNGNPRGGRRFAQAMGQKMMRSNNKAARVATRIPKAFINTREKFRNKLNSFGAENQGHLMRGAESTFQSVFNHKISLGVDRDTAANDAFIQTYPLLDRAEPDPIMRQNFYNRMKINNHLPIDFIIPPKPGPKTEPGTGTGTRTTGSGYAPGSGRGRR